MSSLWINAGVLLLVLLTGGVTLLVVFLIWRDGYARGWRASRHRPPTCPRCGYNLSGLTHIRCPECGTEYRLDALWRTHILKKRSAEGGSGMDNAEMDSNTDGAAADSGLNLIRSAGAREQAVPEPTRMSARAKARGSFLGGTHKRRRRSGDDTPSPSCEGEGARTFGCEVQSENRKTTEPRLLSIMEPRRDDGAE